MRQRGSGDTLTQDTSPCIVESLFGHDTHVLLYAEAQPTQGPLRPLLPLGMTSSILKVPEMQIHDCAYDPLF